MRGRCWSSGNRPVEKPRRASRRRRAKRSRLTALRRGQRRGPPRLPEAVGSTRDELLGAIRSAEERRAAVRGELEDDRKEKTDVDQQVGALRRELDDAQQKVADQDGQRREADAASERWRCTACWLWRA